ncbi:SAICAR synthase-like protein [Coprinellus micaceus]|uniref:Kinase n=1 Tax=Coprinellus micaceus TaxID=71717 RepID=A0A4Y7TN07_COPMI|nr:SAICAR synthase-like protein [Coprinellus micaceus]
MSEEQLPHIPLRPFRNQVGGHSAIYKFTRQAVCKPLVSRENLFYEAVEREAPPLLDFIPRYLGVMLVSYRRDNFILMEDLTGRLKHPCVMDVKMGTRQYGLDATYAKKKSQRAKCKKTTSAELGVRVCGMQVWNHATQSYVTQDKYRGRNIKPAQFDSVIESFLFDGERLLAYQIPVLLQKLYALARIINRLKGFRFYGCSLLLIYDGDKESQEDKTQKAPGYHTDVDPESGLLYARFPPHYPDEPDRGFLFGLKKLTESLEGLWNRERIRRIKAARDDPEFSQTQLAPLPTDGKEIFDEIFSELGYVST